MAPDPRARATPASHTCHSHRSGSRARTLTSRRRGRDLSAISEYAPPACSFNPNSVRNRSREQVSALSCVRLYRRRRRRSRDCSISQNTQTKQAPRLAVISKNRMAWSASVSAVIGVALQRACQSKNGRRRPGRATAKGLEKENRPSEVPGRNFAGTFLGQWAALGIHFPPRPASDSLRCKDAPAAFLESTGEPVRAARLSGWARGGRQAF